MRVGTTLAAGVLLFLFVCGFVFVSIAYAAPTFTRPGPPDAQGLWAECNIAFSDVTAGSGRTVWMSCVYGPADQAVTEAWGSWKQGASPGSGVQGTHWIGEATGTPPNGYDQNGSGLFRMTRTGVTLSQNVDTNAADQPFDLSASSNALSIAGSARKTRYRWSTSNATTFPIYPDNRWPGSLDTSGGGELTDADENACVSGLAGWGFLNPLNYVRGLICSLKRLFIPTSAMADSWSSLSSSAQTHYPLGPVIWAFSKVTAFLTEIPAQAQYALDHPPADCWLSVDLPLPSPAPTSGSGSTFHAPILNNCPDGSVDVPDKLATIRSMSRLFTGGILLFGTVAFFIRLWGWVMGSGTINISGGKGDE